MMGQPDEYERVDESNHKIKFINFALIELLFQFTAIFDFEKNKKPHRLLPVMVIDDRQNNGTMNGFIDFSF